MVRSTQAEAKTGGREAERTENAVFGALMAAFMGVSPFVANGRPVGRRHPLPGRPGRAGYPAPGSRDSAAGCPRAQARSEAGSGYARAVAQPGRTAPYRRGLRAAGAEAGSRVKVWINQAGDVVAPPMQQAEIASRVELAQGLAAAGFAAGLGVIGWLTRQSLGRRRQAA
jgi:hypothetical protein